MYKNTIIIKWNINRKLWEKLKALCIFKRIHLLNENQFDRNTLPYNQSSSLSRFIHIYKKNNQ